MSEGQKKRPGKHAFKIKSGPTLRGGFVEMDGERLRGIQAVTVEASCSGLNAVTVRFVSFDVEVEIDPGLGK